MTKLDDIQVDHDDGGKRHGSLAYCMQCQKMLKRLIKEIFMSIGPSNRQWELLKKKVDEL